MRLWNTALKPGVFKMNFKFKKDDCQTKVQQNVDDLRTCQTERNKLLKELEETKQDIQSVREWAKLVLKGTE